MGFIDSEQFSSYTHVSLKVYCDTIDALHGHVWALAPKYVGSENERKKSRNW